MLSLTLAMLANLAGSFFCSLSEAALLSSSEARIRARLEMRARGAERLLALRLRPGHTLAAIVFLNNVFQIAGTAILTVAAAGVLDSPAGIAGFIVVQTLLMILIGEIAPKVLGEAHPEAIASALAPTLTWIGRILSPLVYLAEAGVRWLRPASRAARGGEAEIRHLTRMGERGGHLNPASVDLIHRVFRLDDITAAEVMTPRPLVKAFPAQATLGEVEPQLLAANHSQFPVYGRDMDTVTGILLLKDALAALARGERDRRLDSVSKPPLFLPSSKAVDAVLRDLQASHRSMAVVIDEYGVTLGIITMDDLVEELVGEAIDATDLSEGIVKRLSRTTALVHGLNRVKDVARFLNCVTDRETLDHDTNTVTGILQERLGRIPVKGDALELPGHLVLEVEEADARMAVRVLAKNAAPQPLRKSTGDSRIDLSSSTSIPAADRPSP